ncbi:uncharacterized protein adgrg7.1 [Pseudochaenichthys georgianus]|uniref:uncharacterized protein adgrg7.1 n=1 Tax=Pseudochaenichthys georgianus TaxID=52239 RepID=UPI00146B5073|nr:uncharacterized protein adgrg7.1 [Pseudochaenichthys georgianus]
MDARLLLAAGLSMCSYWDGNGAKGECVAHANGAKGECVAHANGAKGECVAHANGAKGECVAHANGAKGECVAHANGAKGECVEHANGAKGECVAHANSAKGECVVHANGAKGECVEHANGAKGECVEHANGAKGECVAHANGAKGECVEHANGAKGECVEHANGAKGECVAHANGAKGECVEHANGAKGEYVEHANGAKGECVVHANGAKGECVVHANGAKGECVVHANGAKGECVVQANGAKGECVAHANGAKGEYVEHANGAKGECVVHANGAKGECVVHANGAKGECVVQANGAKGECVVHANGAKGECVVQANGAKGECVVHANGAKGECVVHANGAKGECVVHANGAKGECVVQANGAKGECVVHANGAKGECVAHANGSKGECVAHANGAKGECVAHANGAKGECVEHANGAKGECVAHANSAKGECVVHANGAKGECVEHANGAKGECVEHANGAKGECVAHANGAKGECVEHANGAKGEYVEHANGAKGECVVHANGAKGECVVHANGAKGECVVHANGAKGECVVQANGAKGECVAHANGAKGEYVEHANGAKGECVVHANGAKGECVVHANSAKGECVVHANGAKGECVVQANGAKGECVVHANGAKGECVVQANGAKGECVVHANGAKGECVVHANGAKGECVVHANGAKGECVVHANCAKGECVVHANGAKGECVVQANGAKETNFCRAQKFGKYNFPQTPIGWFAYSEGVCPTGSSGAGKPQASTQCSNRTGAPGFQNPPQIFLCDQTLSDIQKNITSSADLEALASSTQILTSNPEELTVAEVETATEIANTLLMSPYAEESVKVSALATVSQLLNASSQSEGSEANLNLTLTLDELSQNLSLVQPNLVLQAAQIPAASTKGVQFTALSGTSGSFVPDRIKLNDNTSDIVVEDGCVADAVIFVRLTAGEPRLPRPTPPPDSNVLLGFVLYQNDRFFQSRLYTRRRAPIRVLSASIGGPGGRRGGAHRVEMLFRPAVVEGTSLHDFACVFWKHDLQDWSTDGCWKGNASDGLLRCFCNHTTNFAALWSFREEYEYAEALGVLSTVGLSFSLLGLVITIIHHLKDNFQRTSGMSASRRNSQLALLSTCFSLLAFILTFLSGVGNRRPSGAPEVEAERNVVPNSDEHVDPDSGWCSAVAALLHFFLLATFMWNSLYGTQLVLLVRRLRQDPPPHWTSFSMALGWGVPAIIMAVTLGTTYKPDSPLGYRQEEFCWLAAVDKKKQFDFRKPMFWAFLLPVALILIYNVALLVLASLTICRTDAALKSSRPRTLWKKFLISFSLAVLLGVSWSLGYLVLVTSGNTNLVFSVLFCVCTTTQGFQIFVLFTARTPSFRAVVSRSLQLVSSVNIQLKENKYRLQRTWGTSSTESYRDVRQ